MRQLSIMWLVLFLSACAVESPSEAVARSYVTITTVAEEAREARINGLINNNQALFIQENLGIATRALDTSRAFLDSGDTESALMTLQQAQAISRIIVEILEEASRE